MSNEYTKEDYKETVQAIAKDIIEDKGLDDDNWHDRIHEDVDSNSYIIMYAGPPVVKEASDNFPTDMREVCAMAGPDADFDRLLGTAAYLAMQQDVQEACRDLADTAEVCDICDEVRFEDENCVPPLDECNGCKQDICMDCSEMHEATGNILCNECLYDDVEVWDNGGQTIDRYTVVRDGMVFAMNDAPFHPQGFCQFAGERESYPDDMSHCGTYLESKAMPDAVKEWAQVQAFQDLQENQEDLPPDEPSEGDAIYYDSGPLGTKTSVSLDGKTLGEFDTEEEALRHLRVMAKEYKFFPDVWYISDHGNPIQQTDFNWDL
jgi:hypothetical protein